MSYTEKNFQTEFKNKNRNFGVFELKICKGTSIRFDALADHQREALLAVKSDEGLYHKISDFPMFAGSKTRFNFKKPFDCFRLRNQLAMVVVMFYIPRKKKNVYYITIEDWIALEKRSERKSATEEMLKEVSPWEEKFIG